MHYLGACLMFKDAAPYLEEWLQFHLAVGVEHFYLYDNESADDFENVIAPFLEEEAVTLHRWPGWDQQGAAYHHCLQNYRQSSRWIAFLDDDEFLLPVKAESAPEVLSDYENYAGLALSWLLFGSNGHRRRPAGLVTESYTKRAPWIDPHLKCIVDPTRITSPAVLGHSFHSTPGHAIVDENFQPVTGPLHPRPTAGKMCVNHYLIKSDEELRQRRSRLQCNGLPSRSLEEWRAFDAGYNEIDDRRALRFTAKFKDRLSRSAPAYV